MNAEIIAVGTELLLGHTINDDAAHVGRALAGLGIPCYRHVTVGDNPERLAEAIHASLGRADLVVTCGGLGPTVDDVTLETMAAVTGRPLVRRPAILRKIQTRFRRLGVAMPSSNRRQALLPEDAVELPNTVGTAPGFLLKLRNTDNCMHTPARNQPLLVKYLAALPGPPAELIPMLKKHLIPLLRRLRGAGTICSRTLKMTGLTESEVDARVRDLLALSGAATVGIYAHPGQVDLRITARGANRRQAQRRIAGIEKKIRARLKNLVFGADEETLEGAAGGRLKKKRLTLAVAESCTGGLIGHRITEVPGSSDYFLGGVVAYADPLKQFLLGVSPSLLREHGAVSAPAAEAMAIGIRRLTGSDLGLAATGIAGPGGGSKTKPVGLIFTALAHPRGAIVKRFLFSGSRAAIKFKTSQAALDLVRLHLLSSK